ncbi:MAG: radical SAM protein [Clostridiales bacterium]|jgi:putative methyltransferase|nr:radical SAM protein [Clostridiales bacterium]
MNKAIKKIADAKKNNIYFVQIGDVFSGGGESAYLPYAAGAIAAQAFSNSEISAKSRLADILFRRLPLAESLAILKLPFLVGFSSYVWNYEYNKRLAALVKKAYPDCVTVFGGHNIPNGCALLEECGFVDIVIHGEGEEVFEKLLLTLNRDGDLSDIPNLSYRKPCGELAETRREKIIGCDYPSPYTGGIFDKILCDNPDTLFSAILETNRGCVNNCAFCDWGPHKDKVRLFNMERIKGDIEWFSENKIEYIWGADANFGQFDRDLQITQWLINAKAKNGYPKRIKVNYAKNRHENVLKLTGWFAKADLSKSTTVSFQSLSPEVLKNIGRSNMTMESFSKLLDEYRKSGIPTYTELILGLPGETFESFTRGIEMLLDSGQHSIIEVYDCELLPKSALAAPAYKSKHAIRTVKLPFFQYHTCAAEDEEVTEFSDIVVETATMPVEDWIRCKMFTAVFQSLHCMGLLRNVAVYAHRSLSIPYVTFYQSFIEWFFSHQDTFINEVFSGILDSIRKAVEGINCQFYYDAKFGDVRWTLDEGAFLRFSSEIDVFMSEVGDWLITIIEDDEIVGELLKYQKLIVNHPFKKETRESFKFNFPSYFADDKLSAPQRQKTLVTAVPEREFDNLPDYAREIVWYGKRIKKTVLENVREGE